MQIRCGMQINFDTILSRSDIFICNLYWRNCFGVDNRAVLKYVRRTRRVFYDETLRLEPKDEGRFSDLQNNVDRMKIKSKNKMQGKKIWKVREDKSKRSVRE